MQHVAKIYYTEVVIMKIIRDYYLDKLIKKIMD